MNAPIPGQMAPLDTLLGGFIEIYDADAYPEAIAAVLMMENHVMHDPDLPAPVQVFVEGAGTGAVRTVRLHLQGYFIAPLRLVQLNPGRIFGVVRRLVYLERGAPRGTRFRFWLAGILLDTAQQLLTPSGRGP